MLKSAFGTKSHIFTRLKTISVDIMQDVLEGVCKFELADVLHYFVYKAKIINTETSNNLIAGFDFGQNCKRNKLPDISPDSIKKLHLKLSSAEMLCLMRHLGMLIGDLIPENSLVWYIYVTLNEVLTLPLEKGYHRSAYDLHNTLITEHLQLYEAL